MTLPSPVVEVGARYPLQFWKYPETPHWRHDAVVLGEDEFGLWLGAYQGWEAQKGAEPAKAISGDQLHLIPHDDWYVYTYSPTHPQALHWIDTSTPATFEEHRVTAVDLEENLGMWDVSTGELKWTVKTGIRMVGGLTFTGKGKYIVVTSQIRGDLKVFDAKNGKVLHELTGGTVSHGVGDQLRGAILTDSIND